MLALDAKMQFDDNALFRRAAVAELRDYAEEDPRDAEAAKHGLNYIALEGSIGCIVNGAGLAMATMDMITHAGGEPANFLDIGGGASPERVAAAFRLVLSDPRVRCVLVNIFAGINRCDWVAAGNHSGGEGRERAGADRRAARGNERRAGARDPARQRVSIITADTLADAARRRWRRSADTGRLARVREKVS